MERKGFFENSKQIFNLFAIDSDLMVRADGVVDGGSKETEEKACVETGAGLVFQGTAWDDILHDGENISCCIPVA